MEWCWPGMNIVSIRTNVLSEHRVSLWQKVHLLSIAGVKKPFNVLPTIILQYTFLFYCTYISLSLSPLGLLRHRSKRAEIGFKNQIKPPLSSYSIIIGTFAFLCTKLSYHPLSNCFFLSFPISGSGVFVWADLLEVLILLSDKIYHYQTGNFSKEGLTLSWYEKSGCLHLLIRPSVLTHFVLVKLSLIQ